METPLSPLEFARRARRLYPARDAVVDALVRARNEATATLRTVLTTRAAAASAIEAERAALDERRARRARFRAETDPMALERLAMSLERTAAARRTRIVAEAAVARAELDRAAAAGVLP